MPGDLQRTQGRGTGPEFTVSSRLGWALCSKAHPSKQEALSLLEEGSAGVEERTGRAQENE